MNATPRTVPSFLAGGGEVGAIMRAHDWAATPLGPPDAWPQTLRTCVRLMLNTRHPIFLFWGPDHLCLYNDDYCRSIGPEKHPAMLGAPGRVAWPEIWHIIGPQIEQVMGGGEATWHEDHLVPIIRHGARQDVWWTYSYSPIDDDAQGGVGGVLVICKDVTEEHLAREALRRAEARWRAVFENMHEGFTLCEVVYDAAGRPVDFRYLEVNAAVERLTGLPPERLVGRLASEAIPGIERQWLDIYARVVETGEPAHVEHEVATLGRWFEVLAYRTEPRHFAALFLNVTARRAAQARQELMARELDHRAKNLLAVVQAAVRLTRAEQVEDYQRALSGRVAALARTQTLLSAERWDGADLRALVEGELLAFDADGERLTLDGPDLAVPASAAQPIAMALHELATNAIKYGALALAGGHVAVRWSLGADPQRCLHLRWHESGGPALPGPPQRRGFGSRVLDATVRAQLGGRVAMHWPPSGLVCELTVPLLRAADLGDVPDMR